MLLGVDVGGTFTDAVLVDAGGSVRTAKVPTTPRDESAGVLAAARAALAAAGARAPDVARFAHGMTVATNALLEGRTARTALVATDGFGDVLELGRQARPQLYRLCDSAPAPLVPAALRFGAPERMAPGGPVRALDVRGAQAMVARVAGSEPEAVAVALLHAYADPQHERTVGALLAEALPDVHLSLSSELVGTFREYERTATTVVDAALSPLLAAYLRRLSAEAGADGLPEPQIMQSSGGLTETSRASAHAALTVLSGPAGGVAGALLLAERAGERDVLCFDMGGTSCDVCVIEGGRVAETAERTVAGRPLSLPSLDIHTVGAGGGSIAWADPGGALRVGPASAGAEPGPACYGRGGARPTVTDANLLLGRLLEDSPLAGELRLDRDAAERAVAELGGALGMDTMACAEGIVRVAESEMLGALRLVTVERGIDPRRFVLMPFGGAGPLHAAAMAEELGIERILCPSASGVLSALGLAAAAPRRDVSRTVMISGSQLTPERLCREREAILDPARAALAQAPARVRVRYELRYQGQSFELSVDDAEPIEPAPLREAFAREHELRYGYRDESSQIELVTMRATVWGPAPPLRLRATSIAAPARERAPIHFAGRPLEAAVLRGELPQGIEVRGPALCALEESSLLIPPGWSGRVDAHGSCRLRRERERGA